MKSFLKTRKESITKNTIRQKRNIFNLKNSEKNIYKILSSCFEKKKFYLSKKTVFEKYKEKILAIAIFLFTTSPFLYKKKSETLFNFHWKKYTQIFSKKDAINFLNCAVLYLLENSQFSKKDEQEIKECFPEPTPAFSETYVLSIMKKNTEDNYLNLLETKFDQYLGLISISLKLFEIIKYEISRDYSKVLELVKFSNIWKEKISEIFGFKSEYITFLYFLNLRMKKNTKLSEWFLD